MVFYSTDPSSFPWQPFDTWMIQRSSCRQLSDTVSPGSFLFPESFSQKSRLLIPYSSVSEIRIQLGVSTFNCFPFITMVPFS